MRKIGCIATAFTLFFCLTAHADTIYLKNGHVIENVTSSESSNTLTVNVGTGQMTIPMSDVERVEKDSGYRTESPKSAYSPPGGNTLLVCRNLDEARLLRIVHGSSDKSIYYKDRDELIQSHECFWEPINQIRTSYPNSYDIICEPGIREYNTFISSDNE
jgi:hypothetical protein